MRRRNPATRRALLCLALSCVASTACSGRSYWLGGSSGPSGSDGPTTILTGDTVISGSDPIEIGGNGPCRIDGHGYGIVTQGTFSGALWIHDCTFIGLGGAHKLAMDLTLSAPGSLTLERCTFSTSGGIAVDNEDDTSTTFRDNVLYEDATLTLDASVDQSTRAFLALGPSLASKLFQGNRVYRGSVRLASASWLVGGDSDAASNLLIGLRAGLELAAPGLVVRGNYVHDEHLAGAGDESSIATDYSVSDALVEHNVLRRGSWVVRGFGGEFRYNAVFDADNLAFIQQPFENTKLHHNLLAMCSPAIDGALVQGGIELVNTRAAGIEIYNNTLDGGAAAIVFGGPALSVDAGSLLASLRSNLIQHFFFKANAGDAAILPGPTEASTPAPVRLGYADYNLFDNQSEVTLRNYGLAVAGLSERKDAGFALHDASPGGSLDQQLSAQLASGSYCGALSDDQLRAGSLTVSQLLAALRASITPLPGSPALGGGDPADGANNFIGAVGDGTLADDRFGRLAAP